MKKTEKEEEEEHGQRKKALQTYLKLMHLKTWASFHQT
jgi:hypothetical protein